ncbi:tetraspanin-5-like [Asterias rubens]|uniref:tetraspanin-5-like n=1 Tax=Asterias rubens TaxID=7604 RepID=UPI00145556F3|nr:tetraspanin-5-like [Asterias rubens]
MKHSVQPSRGDDDGALAPFTVQQQMRYPEMQQQGYYLQSPPQQSQLSPQAQHANQQRMEQHYANQQYAQQQHAQQHYANQQHAQQRQQQQQRVQPKQQQQQQRVQPKQQQQQQEQRQQPKQGQQPKQQKQKNAQQPKQQQQQQQQRSKQPAGKQGQQQRSQPKKQSFRRFRRAPPGVEVSHCIKYTIFFLNFIFWLLGVFLLGFGIWGVVSKALASIEVIAEVAGIGFDPMYGFIIVGAIIFILATSGCIGALRENTCMLKFFVYSLILIFLAEITLGVLAYFYQDAVFQILEKWLDKSIEEYYDDPDTQFIMDSLQESLQCCGSAKGPEDWEQNIYFSCDSPAISRCSVPYSCCMPDDDGVVNYQCGFQALSPDASADVIRQQVFTTGCVEGMKSWFITNAIALGIAGGILIVLECLVICLTKSLINDIECVKSYW